jgi:HSP20 family molecular chaperone IbpA
MLTLYSNRNFDRLFNDMVMDVFQYPYGVKASNLPTIKNGIATVSYDVPGIPKDKIKVSWKDDVLYVEGKTDVRSVKQSVSLPDIDTTTLKAECVDGILTITANIKKHDEGVVAVKVL